jgi:hypothetical protein
LRVNESVDAGDLRGIVHAHGSAPIDAFDL